jgi:hypothetical protein
MCCDVVCVREAVLLWVSAVELLLCALALLHMAVLSSTRKKLLENIYVYIYICIYIYTYMVLHYICATISNNSLLYCIMYSKIYCS